MLARVLGPSATVDKLLPELSELLTDDEVQVSIPDVRTVAHAALCPTFFIMLDTTQHDKACWPARMKR